MSLQLAAHAGPGPRPAGDRRTQGRILPSEPRRGCGVQAAPRRRSPADPAGVRATGRAPRGVRDPLQESDGPHRGGPVDRVRNTRLQRSSRRLQDGIQAHDAPAVPGQRDEPSTILGTELCGLAGVCRWEPRSPAILGHLQGLQTSHDARTRRGARRIETERGACGAGPPRGGRVGERDRDAERGPPAPEGGERTGGGAARNDARGGVP